MLEVEKGLFLFDYEELKVMDPEMEVCMVFNDGLNSVYLKIKQILDSLDSEESCYFFIGKPEKFLRVFSSRPTKKEVFVQSLGKRCIKCKYLATTCTDPYSPFCRLLEER